MRLFLDTNVYIIGVADAESDEGRILDWLGFGGHPTEDVEVIVSEILFTQIRRVARRVGGKDWSGQIVTRIWRHMPVRFVILDAQLLQQAFADGLIPREDVEIFVTAQVGDADYFVSSNYELIRKAARATGVFDCLTPADFVAVFGL